MNHLVISIINFWYLHTCAFYFLVQVIKWKFYNFLDVYWKFFIKVVNYVHQFAWNCNENCTCLRDGNRNLSFIPQTLHVDEHSSTIEFRNKVENMENNILV